MRKSIVTAVLAAIPLAAPLEAQGRGMGATRAGMPGCAAGTSFCLYDTTTVATMKGDVISVDTMGAGRMGVRLQVRSGKETVAVHLGPAWVLERDGLKLKPGDRVEIVGSRVQFAGSPAVIARTVTKAGKTVTLRDRAGIPLWTVGRMGGGD